MNADANNDNGHPGRPSVEHVERHGDDLDDLCAKWSSPLAVVWWGRSVDDNAGVSVCIQVRVREGTEAMPIWLEPASIGDAWAAFERSGVVITRRPSLASLIAALKELPAWNDGEEEESPNAA